MIWLVLCKKELNVMWTLELFGEWSLRSEKPLRILSDGSPDAWCIPVALFRESCLLLLLFLIEKTFIFYKWVSSSVTLMSMWKEWWTLPVHVPVAGHTLAMTVLLKPSRDESSRHFSPRCSTSKLTINTADVGLSRRWSYSRLRKVSHTSFWWKMWGCS